MCYYYTNLLGCLTKKHVQHTVVIGIFMNTLICVCNNVLDEWISDILFECVESFKTIETERKCWKIKCGTQISGSKRRKALTHYIFHKKELINFFYLYWKIPKWVWNFRKCQEGMQSVTMDLKKKKPPKRIKRTRSYTNNWQYCWVRWRLLWKEQFWLLDASFRRWGERKNFIIIYCVYTNIGHWRPSTCR